MLRQFLLRSAIDTDLVLKVAASAIAMGLHSRETTTTLKVMARMKKDDDTTWLEIDVILISGPKFSQLLVAKRTFKAMTLCCLLHVHIVVLVKSGGIISLLLPCKL